jgi:hypothetical protein
MKPLIELIENILNGLKERVGNPFIVAYILSFSIYNFEAISLYLNSKLSIEIRHVYIKSVLELELWEVLLIPFGSAISYVVVMPWLILGIIKISNYPKKISQRIVMAAVTEELAITKKRTRVLLTQEENDRMIIYNKDKKIISHLRMILDIVEFRRIFSLLHKEKSLSEEQWVSLEKLFDFLSNREIANISNHEINSQLLTFSSSFGLFMHFISKALESSVGQDGHRYEMQQGSIFKYLEQNFKTDETNFLKDYEEFWKLVNDYLLMIGQFELEIEV